MGKEEADSEHSHDETGSESGSSTAPVSAENGHDHNTDSDTNEREFLTGMIPHHQEAVDTAKQVLARGGTSPEMITLAENIVTTQEKEIVKMKQWYKTWYGESYTDDESSHTSMMRDLTSLSGTELDKTFLEDMIMHHRDALLMAQEVAPYTQHPELRALIEGIAKDQSEEIITMRVLLKQF